MKRNITLTLFALLISVCTLFGQATFQMPSENWKLEIDLEGFKIQKSGYSPDSTIFQLSAINDKTGFNLSIFVEKTDSIVGKEECREFYWNKAKNSPLAKENLKKYETDNAAVVEFDTKEFNGQVVDFHSLNAYLTQNGYWIDVHLSTVGFSKKDEKTFTKILESIRIK